jgi:hypothetical protein
MNKELTDQITVKRVRERVRARFRKMAMRNGKGDSPNTKQKVALAFAPKKCKGKCQLCGKFGHKKVNCHENEGKSNKNFSSFQSSKSNHNNGKNSKTCSATTARKKDTQKPNVMPKKERKEKISNRATMMLC